AAPDRPLARRVGLGAHARLAKGVGDTKPLERCGRIRQNCIDANAKLVRTLFRFVPEIDSDDTELGTLRRDSAHQPHFAGSRRHYGARCGFAVTGCDLHDFAKNPLWHCYSGATPAAVCRFARAREQHDVALYDAREVILDCRMNIRDVECNSQAPRESIEVAQVDLALAGHFKLALEARRELTYGHGDENEQNQVDDFLGILDAETVGRFVEKERRGDHTAYRCNDR